MTIHDEAEVRASTFDDGALCDDPCRDRSAASGCICTTTATIIRTLSARLKAVEAERDAIERQFSSVSDGYSQLQLNRRTK